jgi:glycosyltransferase involved in cell wall biosynthesis
MIGVATAEFGRYAAFHDYFNLLDKPEGSVCVFTHGQSPAKARNLIIEAAMEHDCTHVLFLDDDMVFPPDTLTKLMVHDLDVVSAYYLMRTYPHQGLIFDFAEEDGKAHWYEVGPDETGIKEVVAAGLGCALFKLSVFEKIEPPYVRLGEIEPDGWCDDIGLFKRLREAGVKIHMDLGCPVGHISSFIVTPANKNGEWYINYNTFGTESVEFPMLRKAKNGGTEIESR